MYNFDPSSKLILITDDTAKNIQILGKILVDEGYKVCVAENGKEAIEVALIREPDLILLDVMMPTMNGIEACKILKSDEKTAAIPVIFLTALTEAKDAAESFRVGAVDHIGKPFDRVELLARVKTHLEIVYFRQRLEREIRSKHELLRLICHDLVNPISAARYLTEYILEDDSKIRKTLPKVSDHLDSALKIIESNRNKLAVSEGIMPSRCSLLNLQDLIKESLSVLDHRVEEKGLSIVEAIDSSIVVFVERYSFIYSVINNILTNAIKYSDRNTKIEIYAANLDQSLVELKIRDYGIGMDQKIVDSILNEDLTSSHLGTSGELGTGYGMGLLKKFIISYGGCLKVRSKEKTKDASDHGTEITLQLPRKAPAA